MTVRFYQDGYRPIATEKNEMNRALGHLCAHIAITTATHSIDQLID